MAYYVDTNGKEKKVLSVVRLGAKIGTFDGNGKSYGTYYAIDEGLDGYGKVVYTAIGYDKAFVEGSTAITQYGIDSGISRVCAYALSSFSALSEVRINNETSVLSIDRNAFINTPIENGTGKIYVPDDLLARYEATYNTQMGKSWAFEAYTNYAVWTIPYVSGATSTTLTLDYVAQEYSANPVAKYASKVSVPVYFTDYGTDCLSSVPMTSLLINLDKSFLGTTNFPSLSIFGTNLEEVEIRNLHDYSLGDRVFQNVSTIRRIVLNNCTGFSGAYTFNNCTALEEIDLGNIIRGIQTHAFDNCTALTEITIPSSVASLSNFAIYVPNLAKAWFLHDSSVPTYGYAAMPFVQHIYFRTSVLETAMTATNWVALADRMVGYIDLASGESFPTFTGYTATWYGDEDCENVITSPIVGRNYVRLS